jgi:hypothetical protein
MISDKWKLITGIVVLIALGLVFFRDTLLEKGGTPDLRNRIVGARLQKDGIAPYYYRWHAGDSIRYYGTTNYDNGVSNITSSPFQHTLLTPISGFQQRTISLIWLLVEYLLLITTGLLAYRLSKNNTQKIIVCIAFLLFLCTEAWKVHIIQGQTYILVPFLAMIIYYCLTKHESRVAAFIGGLTAITLVLTRPNAIIFFLPFLFLINTYSRRYLTWFIAPILLLSAFYFSFENNRTYWKQYPAAVQASMLAHQGLIKRDTSGMYKKVKLKEYEGWNSDDIKKATQSDLFIQHSEHGNIFIFYRILFNKPMPVKLMNMFLGCAIVVLLSIYYFARKKYGAVELPNVVMLAFCLYMISDLSSPVWRHQYYTMQWLFPVLVAASVYRPTYKWLYGGLLLALLLNIINTDVIKLEHTIGEYLILLILLYMSLTKSFKAAGSA